MLLNLGRLIFRSKRDLTVTYPLHFRRQREMAVMASYLPLSVPVPEVEQPSAHLPNGPEVAKEPQVASMMCYSWYISWRGWENFNKRSCINVRTQQTKFPFDIFCLAFVWPLSGATLKDRLDDNGSSSRTQENAPSSRRCRSTFAVTSVLQCESTFKVRHQNKQFI